jgi:hypothetical protein
MDETMSRGLFVVAGTPDSAARERCGRLDGDR